MAMGAGGAAASRNASSSSVGVQVAVPTQVTPVLLHDAAGSELRCLALSISPRKEEKPTVVSPRVTVPHSQLCNSKVVFEKGA